MNKKDTSMRTAYQIGLINSKRDTPLYKYCLELYDTYVKVFGVPMNEDLENLTLYASVGYFARMHTRDPKAGVEQAYRNNYITYDKRSSLLVLLSQLT